MVSKQIMITNPMGLHMRPAGVFANAMMKFDSEVTLVAGGKTVNAKSIMSLMAAGIKCGAQVEVQCSGPDEEAALLEAVRQIESGLGE